MSPALRRGGFVLAALLGTVLGIVIGCRPDRAPEPAAAQAPVEVLARPALPPADASWRLMLPADLSAADRPPATSTCDNLYPWGVERGGMPARSRVLIQIRARRDLRIEVTGAAARIVAQHPAKRQVVLDCAPRGWRPETEPPEDPPLYLDSDRVWPEPVVLSALADPPNRLRLDAGEYAEFELVAMSRFQDIEWELEVRMTIDGRPHSVITRNGDRPFVTPAFPHGAGYLPPGYQWCWSPQPPHLERLSDDFDAWNRCHG